jgi:hypothetical protein
VRVGEVLAMPAPAATTIVKGHCERAHTCYECERVDFESFMHQVSVSVADYSGLVKRFTSRRVWVCGVCYTEPAQE